MATSSKARTQRSCSPDPVTTAPRLSSGRCGPGLRLQVECSGPISLYTCGPRIPTVRAHPEISDCPHHVSSCAKIREGVEPTSSPPGRCDRRDVEFPLHGRQ